MADQSNPRRTLRAGARALAGSADLDEVLTRLLGIAVAEAGADAAIAYLHHDERVTLEAVTAAGLGLDSAATEPIPLGDEAHGAARAARERRTVTTEDGGRVFVPSVVASAVGEVLVGVLEARYFTGRPPTRRQAELLATIADLAAVAIDRARLQSTLLERGEWFERLATVDPLTGLANRRTLERVLELELVRAARQGSKVAVALFDIDDLEAVNAAGGQPAGDDLLRRTAAVLNETVRLVDTVARYGGDEFVLVAPGSFGATVAERVVAVAATDDGSGAPPISLSAGVANFPDDATTADGLLSAAERALHSAKQAGRGRVVVSSPRDRPAPRPEA